VINFRWCNNDNPASLRELQGGGLPVFSWVHQTLQVSGIRSLKFKAVIHAARPQADARGITPRISNNNDKYGFLAHLLLLSMANTLCLLKMLDSAGGIGLNKHLLSTIFIWLPIT
jgi:hypothetical protein